VARLVAEERLGPDSVKKAYRWWRGVAAPICLMAIFHQGLVVLGRHFHKGFGMTSGIEPTANGPV
jgi:hypothetical protein